MALVVTQGANLSCMAEPPSPGDPGPGRTLSTLRAAAGGLALGLVVDHFKGVQFGITFTVVIAATFVLTVLEQLRRLQGAPLARLVTRVCLLGAATAAVVAVLAPPNWMGVAVVTTAALALAGSLGPARPDERWFTLCGVAGIGAGVAMIGFALVRSGDLLLRVAGSGSGVAIIGFGVALARGSDFLLRVAVIGGGVAIIGFGVALARGGDLLLGVAVIGGGVATIGSGVALARGSDFLLRVAGIGGGVAMIGAGVASARSGDLLGGVTGIGIGVAAIGLGVALTRGSNLLFGVSGISLGVISTGFGVDSVRRGDLLGGVAVIGIGVASIGAVMVLVRWDSRIVTWWRTLTSVPQQETGAVRVAEDDGSDRAT